jgi:hypothetical protein
MRSFAKGGNFARTDAGLQGAKMTNAGELGFSGRLAGVFGVVRFRSKRALRLRRFVFIVAGLRLGFLAV